MSIETSTVESVVSRAQDFAESLSDTQRDRLYRPRNPTTMADWSNYPQQVMGKRHRRGGLATETLTAPQWESLFTLLEAGTGSGAERIRGHLTADEHLRELGGHHGYGRGEFVVAFLGTPSATGTWQLQFGGHHLAVAHTYTDGELVSATPSFRGMEPYAPFRYAGRSHDPERRSRLAMSALIAALDGARLSRARVRSRRDIRLGPGIDWRFPSFRKGLCASGLDDDGRALLLEAIASFVDDCGPRDAARVLGRYAEELDDTYVGWSGARGLRHVGDYVRITGPSVWIELSLHGGIVCRGPHAHSVWRDRRTDYGGTRF